jgi:hypothetical protein
VISTAASGPGGKSGGPASASSGRSRPPAARRRGRRLRDGWRRGHPLAAGARAQQLVLRRLAGQVPERARELADQVGLDGGRPAALVLGQQCPRRGRDLSLDGPREGVGRVVEEHAAA